MIKEKRKSLEKFIEEQIIGPGGCADRYSVHHTDCDASEDISFGEVLNTTPGSIYSSAILFPQKDNDNIKPNDIDESLNVDDDEQDSEETGDDAIEDERNVDHSEDLDSLGRRFPNKFGLSCCLDRNKANKDLHITISGRYYKKIKNIDSLRIKVDNVNGFKSFIEDSEFVRLMGRPISLDDNFIKIIQDIPPKQIGNVRENLREVNRYFCKKVATNSDGSICSIYTEDSFKVEYRFLSAYKERLFSKLNYFDSNGIYVCADKQTEIKKRIELIEEYETYISYLEDVISAFDPKGFGFWEAVSFSKVLDLTTIDITSKRIFKADDHDCLKDIVKIKLPEDLYLSLDVWLQSIQINNKLFLKVLLVNSSTKVKDGDVRYFSIVTEKVNERSFFGVSIDISSPYLLEYHKDNKYDALDKEANDLRFLYRNIKDYGVGHLCSVNWEEKDGIMHIWSDFLPKIETPDVEPIPRNKQEFILENEKVFAKPYLDNPKCLQFKWLSIFSDASDKEIVDGLLEFISSYGEWINNLNTENNDIAEKNKQLCQNDYERIKRNIEDFLSDSEKMRSFRLMNAAMFMQLWHNTLDNKAQIVQDQKKLTFDYYKNHADDTTIFKNTHAAWRPFKLSFILLNNTLENIHLFLSNKLPF